MIDGHNLHLLRERTPDPTTSPTTSFLRGPRSLPTRKFLTFDGGFNTTKLFREILHGAPLGQNRVLADDHILVSESHVLIPLPSLPEGSDGVWESGQYCLN